MITEKNHSSKTSAQYAQEARQAVLDFFHAPPGYTVVFTSNASGALKLVGEAFPFRGGSAFLLCEDAHNSVHGIREYASRKGASVTYIESTVTGGLCVPSAKASEFVHITIYCELISQFFR